MVLGVVAGYIIKGVVVCEMTKLVKDIKDIKKMKTEEIELLKKLEEDNNK